MEIENRVELPDGHLVNLSPRPQRQQGQYQAYRGEFHATELSATPLPRYTHQPRPYELEEVRTSGDIMFQRGKATKLPLPNSSSTRDRDQRHQTPSPTAIPKPTSGLSPVAAPAAAPTGRSRDQCWRRIRDKFEKDSPLSQKHNQRQKHTEKSVSASQVSSWQQNKHASSSTRADQAPTKVVNSRSAIPSPKGNTTSPVQSTRNDSCPAEPQKKWKKEGDQWVSNASKNVKETTRAKSESTDTTTDSSPRSNPSVSPVSAEDSSMTDWEDQFVVNMPSAKEPNPPMMTEQQIAEYQHSIGRVHRPGGRPVDAKKPLPSPRNPVPDEKRRVEKPRDQPTVQFKAYDGQSLQPHPTPEPKSAVTSQGQEAQEETHYYSPDEVGKNRISTIWEESSPSRPKEKRSSQNDGSFLGCKEINGPGTKNPDEILLFACGEESASLQPRPLALSAKKRLKERRLARKSEENRKAEERRKSEENTALQEEWTQISQNSKHVQCSKPSPSTICREPDCSQSEILRSDSQTSAKENSQPTGSAQSSPGKLEDNRSDDDVFIITPTITRTMIPTPSPEQDEKGSSLLKPSGLRRPGGIGQLGTGEAVKAVRAKAQVISTVSGLRPATKASQEKSTEPSPTSSKTNPLGSIPMAKEKELKIKQKGKGKDAKDKGKSDSDRPGYQTASSIRGFIRTSGLARSTGMVRSPTDSLASILRSGTESLRNRAENLRNGSGSIRSRKASLVSPSTVPSRDNSESSRSERSFKSALETPVSSARPTPIKKESPVARIAAAHSPPPEKKPPAENTPPPETGKPKTAEKSPSSEKQLSRAERLEKFKEQARARRATKVIEIAELDGHQVALQPNITDVSDVCDELQDLNPRDKEEVPKQSSNAITLALIFEIMFIAITHVHKFGLQLTHSPYALFLLANVINMARHCYHVSTRVYRMLSHYQATGTWPKAKNDQAISRFLIETLQAVVYLFVLGFGALVIGRAAWYVFLVGSWLMWFARPFAWTFQCVCHAMLG
ncbi:hypothetical protein N7492_005316 [Penicillium capsulatum]|uniref:NTP binding protein n=1 Tax=Penicillium capsulatum TaxID=69766 RepID=A0A9W9IBK9_9EURO|nr:hypothetical protein N7492_005316 [Penicillium capsulatum]KAJ6135581.1 hypothetical protein N7512_000741 [Penicillium capsulatum]